MDEIYDRMETNASTPSRARDGGDAPASGLASLFRKVSTPLRGAASTARELALGFFAEGGDAREVGGSAHGDDVEARVRRSDGAMKTPEERGNGGIGRTRFASEAEGRNESAVSRLAREEEARESDSPTPFTEIKEFLRRGVMDRERVSRMGTIGGAFGGGTVLEKSPTSPFERAPAFETRAMPTLERPAATPSANDGQGAASPGYASVRRSYGASGTPSLLGTRGRPMTKPTILEPPTEQAPTPPRTSLKRERELTFMDLERERARVTTPRRLDPNAHSPGPGALARESEVPTYQTPTTKTVTSAVTTDTARRILQRLDQLAGGRTATPTIATAPRQSLFATRPAQTPKVNELTPTSATFVQTPKSGVSFAASPMPFISSSSSRPPTTPYPTGDLIQTETETPNLKFKFGEDNVLLATGKKPKAPSGPVAEVSAKFTFGEGESTPLFPKKTVPPPLKTSAPPPPKPAEESKKSDDAPASKPVIKNLWSADFLAKNQEHQKKVQAAIDEEEKASAKPSGTPSPFAPAPATTGDKSAFAFGIPASGAGPSSSTGAAGFSFGSTAPAATGAAAGFSFEPTASAKGDETAKVASDSGLLAFLGASSGAAKTAAPPSSAPTFTFGAPPKSPENVPVKAPEPTPTFKFGMPEEKPVRAAVATPFTFGAKPAETEDKKEQLSASAPAFTPAAPKTTEPPASTPFTFGTAAPAKDDSKPAGEVPKPLFSFGGSSSAKPTDDAQKPASGGFTFGASTAVASDAPKPASGGFSFGASKLETPKEDNPKPASGGFTFGASSTAAASEAPKPASSGFTFGASSTAAASDAPKPASSGFTFGSSAPKEDAPKPASGGFTFGATAVKDDAPKPASGGFTFGASGDAKPASSGGGFAFGGTSASGAASDGFTFGGSTAAPAATGGGFTFGASTSSAPTSTPFGGGLTVKTQATGVFGQSKADEQPPTPEPMSPFETSKSPVAAAPAFGGSGSANPFGGGSSAGANPFGGSSTGVNPFGAASSTPAFGSTSSAPATAGGANPFGGASSAPAFGGGAPAFGGAPASANPFAAGAGGAPGGGFSMGGAGGGEAQGGRKPLRKFKRPPKR